MITEQDKTDFAEFIKGQTATNISEWEGSIVIDFESGNSIVFFHRDDKQQMEVT